VSPVLTTVHDGFRVGYKGGGNCYDEYKTLPARHSKFWRDSSEEKKQTGASKTEGDEMGLNTETIAGWGL